MTMKDLTKKFIAEFRAGQVGEALDTAAEILKSSAGFYKLLFGGSAVSVTASAEDLADEEAELNKLHDEVASKPAAMAAATGAGGPTGAAVEPALALMVIDVVLKLIAERRKRKAGG